MKFILFVIGLLTACYSFSQPYTNDNYVQNFYIVCKTQKRSVFNNLYVGTQLLDNWQYSRSINRYSKAFQLDSNCCDALYMLAYCYQRQGLLDQAISYCKMSIEINANNPSAWTIMGTTLLMKNDTQSALNAFENAKKYAPDKIDGYQGIALTYFIQKKYNESVTVINEFEKMGNKNTNFRDIKKMKKLKSNMVTKE